MAVQYEASGTHVHDLTGMLRHVVYRKSQLFLKVDKS